MALADHCLS